MGGGTFTQDNTIHTERTNTGSNQLVQPDQLRPNANLATLQVDGVSMTRKPHNAESLYSHKGIKLPIVTV